MDKVEFAGKECNPAPSSIPGLIAGPTCRLLWPANCASNTEACPKGGVRRDQEYGTVRYLFCLKYTQHLLLLLVTGPLLPVEFPGRLPLKLWGFPLWLLLDLPVCLLALSVLGVQLLALSPPAAVLSRGALVQKTTEIGGVM